MKQNTFYVLAGFAGLIEVGIFWLSVQYRMPFLITAAFIAGIVLLYGAWHRITDLQVDERAALINQKAGMATFMVFWVIFFCNQPRQCSTWSWSTQVSPSSTTAWWRAGYPEREHEAVDRGAGSV